MLNTLIFSLLISCNANLSSPTDMNLSQNLQTVSGNGSNKILIAHFDPIQLPGPIHGDDPHGEIHDYGLPGHPNYSNDPYGGTIPSDPYGGTQGFYTDPYAGTAPWAAY